MGAFTISENRILQAHEALAVGLAESLSTLKDVETEQRGYVLTGDLHYLEPYKAAVRKLKGQLDELSKPPTRIRLDQKDLDELKNQIAAKLAELQETIVRRERSGLDAAVASAIANADNQKMLVVRAKVADDRARKTAHRRGCRRRQTNRSRFGGGCFSLLRSSISFF